MHSTLTNKSFEMLLKWKVEHFEGFDFQYLAIIAIFIFTQQVLIEPEHVLFIKE